LPNTGEAAERNFSLFVDLADGICLNAFEFIRAGSTLMSPNEVITVERSEFAKSRQLRGAQGSQVSGAKRRLRQDQQCYSHGEWQGALSFGYFSLGKQRKVTNIRG
jgi:hypothetical protein